jgi:hypothetical protein
MLEHRILYEPNCVVDISNQNGVVEQKN